MCRDGAFEFRLLASRLAAATCLPRRSQSSAQDRLRFQISHTKLAHCLAAFAAAAAAVAAATAAAAASHRSGHRILACLLACLESMLESMLGCKPALQSGGGDVGITSSTQCGRWSFKASGVFESPTYVETGHCSILHACLRYASRPTDPDSTRSLKNVHDIFMFVIR